ncbi:MAG: tetratricopeptide repeat protein [Gemmatimonadota bacterium]|nr:MAG: tetratricopeptide repeat protein [Gemmatimonadota bacterium]
MKKVAIAVAAVLALLFVAITMIKGRSPTTSDQLSETDSLATEDRAQIQQFWRYYRSATQHRTTGDLRRAAEGYQQALELNPEHEDALYYLGSMHFDLGEFRDAELAWQRLTEVAPTGSRGHSRLGSLYFCFEQDEYFDLAKAQLSFERALELNSEETGPLLYLGQIALVSGNDNRAVEYFDAVTATNFRSVPAYFFKGYIAWRGGDTTTAEELFRQAALHQGPAQPVEGVLSEGDTRSGAAILAESEQCKAFIVHAESLPGPDDPHLRSLMNDRYQQLDTFLGRR